MAEQKPDFDKRRIEVGLEAIRLLDIIAAEFKTDPTSVQCFDRTTVASAIALSQKAHDLGYLHEAWRAYNEQK